MTHLFAYSKAVFGVFLLAALPACKEENKYEPPPAPKVGVAQPVKRPVTRYLELTGNTVSLDKVELVARAAGFLREINYKDGSMAKKGDVLFVIEPAPYEAKVQQAEADWRPRKAAADYAEAEFQRQYTLSQTTQFGWQSKFYEAQKNRDEKRANLQKAQAALELAKIELGYTKVTAPFDGIVTTHLAAVGALVGGGSSPTPLATILRLDPIYVTANLSEQDVLRIIADPSGISTADLGKIPIELGLMDETGYPHKGVIDYIAPQVDPSTGTLRVRGVFANPDYALLPGLFAHVRVSPSQGPEQEALLYPRRRSAATRPAVMCWSSTTTMSSTSAASPSAPPSTTCGSSKRGWHPKTGSSSPACCAPCPARRSGRKPSRARSRSKRADAAR